MIGISKEKKKKGRGLFKELIVIFTCLTFVFAGFMSVATADIKARTDMKHTPPGYFIPKYRIQLDAVVSDPGGVERVRCYFKSAGEADFVFVSMTNTGGDNYSGMLPAPSSATEEIEYLFLAVNAENEIVKSQEFLIARGEGEEPPAWQEIPGEEEIRVSMELDQVPSEVPGFSDNIVMDQVESGLRFGVAAGGLYQLTAAKTAATSGAAASAASAGTVAAGSAGVGTTGLAALGVAGAVTAGGVAAASGGSGRSAENLNEENIVGHWQMEGSVWGGECTFVGDITFNRDGSFSYSGVSMDGDESEKSGYGSWGYDSWEENGGDILEILPQDYIWLCQARICCGDVSGTSRKFTFYEVEMGDDVVINFSR